MARILIYGNPNSPLVRARGLLGQKAGHKIFWVSHEKVSIKNVKSYGLPKWIANILPLRSFFEPIIVMRAIREVHPDLIHVHYASKGISAYVLKSSQPLIVSVMGSDILPEASFRWPYAHFTRLMLDKADVITSKSAFLDKAILEIGDYKNKIKRITWGVDLELYKINRPTNHLRGKWSIPNGSKVFFDPRSAKSLYNKELIINAFARYQAQGNPHAVLLIATIAAESGYLSKLVNRVREIGVEDHVRFLEPLSSEEMADTYCLSDVTVSVPKSDGMPHSILEAMACGSYLLLSDLPQYQEIADKNKGVRIIPENDSLALSEGFKWVSENGESAVKMGAGNRTFVKRYADLQRQSELVFEIYNELIGNGKQK